MKNRFPSIVSGVSKIRQTTVTNISRFASINGKQQLKEKVRLAGKAFAPLFAAILVNVVLHEAAHAQTSGGPIFSGNSSNLANIIREGLKLFAILLFCGGALGIGAAIWNKMWGKEWGNYAIGGGAAFAFGTIIAVIYSISQGRAVDINTNF